MHKLIEHSGGSFSADPVLICVHPDAIDDIWPHVRGYIESAFGRGRGDDNADIVLADLKSNNSLLWIIWDSDARSILAALTTKLMKTSRGLVCRITACGGAHVDRWVRLISGIEDYAKAEGCRCMRAEGRKGWKAMLPDYLEPWIVLEKRL